LEEKQPFKAVLENDMKALAAAGEKGLAEIIMTTHAGMTTEEFEHIVKDWLATAKHPGSTGPLPTWYTSPCWNCSFIFGKMVSRPTSFRWWC